MFKYKTLLLIPLLSLSFNVHAEKMFLNDLDCMEFSTQDVCVELNKSLNEIELSSFEAMTFDNQLKKITHLLRKDKEKIAKKRYKIFLDSAYDTLNKENATFLMQYESDIWSILKKYSESEHYTANPHYKL